MTLLQVIEVLAEMDSDNRTTEAERLEVAKVLMAELHQRNYKNGVQERPERESGG